MRIGLVPGGFKPYHAGHDALIRAASAENDRVIVFYSTADRSRKGELPISGKNAARVLHEIVSATLPSNVTLREVKAPVGAVFEALISAEDLHARRCADDTYTIYAGSDDEKNFANIEKYAPRIVKEGHVRLFSLERGSDTPGISGTLMRKSLREGNVHLFSEGLPVTLKPKAKEIIKTLGFNGDSVTRVPRRGASESHEGTDKSKSFANYSRSNLRDVVMSDFLSEVSRQNHQLLTEDGDFGAYDSWTASPNILIKTFVAPFANIVKASKTLGLDMANIGSIPARALAAKIKGSDSAFADAMNGYKNSKKKIEKMWEPITKYSDQALSGDAQLLAFCLAPQEYAGIALAKTFKNVIVGRANDSSSGLIGTLASSGLLPDEWTEKWKNIKEKDSESEDEDEAQAKREKAEIDKARNRLRRDLSLVSSALAAGSLADFDGRDDADSKIKDLIQKIKKNDTKNISSRHLGSFYEDSSVLAELKAAIAQSDDLDKYEKIKLKNALSRIYNDLEKISEGDEKKSVGAYPRIKLDREQIVDESFRAAYTALYACFKSFAKNALFFSALQKAKSLKDLNKELRILGIDGGAELDAFTKEIEKAVAENSADKEKAYAAAVVKIKAEIAKSISETQQQTIKNIRDISTRVLPAEGPASKIIGSSEEGKDLRKILQLTEKGMNELMQGVHSGRDVSNAATAIKNALGAMKKKSES